MKTTMKIRIEGARYTPEWETLQNAIRQSTGRDGKLTRISRKDGRCGYREPGEYELTLICEDADEIEISLSVNR